MSTLTKLFDSSASPPQLTPEARIMRAASRSLELQALLSPQHTRRALRDAASRHSQAALRCTTAAEMEPELTAKLGHLEEAGHHASAALTALDEAERRS